MLKSVTECIPSECSKEHKRLQRDPLNHKWTVFCFFFGGVFSLTDYERVLNQLGVKCRTMKEKWA